MTPTFAKCGARTRAGAALYFRHPHAVNSWPAADVSHYERIEGEKICRR